MIAIWFLVLLQSAAPPTEAREVVTVVERIRRADYEGDRAALAKLVTSLEPYVANQTLGSRVRYWRGFAWWRRAFNGFNENTDPGELRQDLTQGIREFEAALAAEPEFVDAKVGLISCLMNLTFLTTEDAKRTELVTRFVQLSREALAAAPDNPRLLWVLGASQFNNPPERRGGQDVAIATYTKGLAAAREMKGRATDLLRPSWGEAELLMNLAYSHLNHAKPNVVLAEEEALAALALVPHWHYVRDILLPQIRRAKGQHY